MFCINCGKELPKTAIYCPFCGSNVEDYNHPVSEEPKQKQVAAPIAKPISKPEIKSAPQQKQNPELKPVPKSIPKPEPRPEPDPVLQPVPEPLSMTERQPQPPKTVPAPTTAEKAKEAVFIANSALGSFSRSQVQTEDAIGEVNSDEWVTWVPDPTKRR